MSPQLTSYSFLALAIIIEVVGSSFLMKSEQFTKPVPTILTAICYIATFYFLSLALKTIPLGVAYGIWGSLGIVLTAIMGFVIFKQKLDPAAMIGIALMVSGVVVTQVFSKTTTH